MQQPNHQAQHEPQSALARFTENLVTKAQEARLDPIIGRDEEIRAVIEVLQRRTKNNPVLIGEPGVGKTAIVEGLAMRLFKGEVPEGLKNYRVLALDLAGMIAGAKYRGEFEERLKALLAEIRSSQDVILFIDEVHMLVGSGQAEGGLDAGNMLKPELARGTLHCIGATTLDEYRKYIEKDNALERRFQKILVSEPSVESTLTILRGLKERYELHHGLSISDRALVAAAKLSDRYISDRKLPDKAIDLIDEAASMLRTEIDSKPESLDGVERSLLRLKIERESLKKDKSSEAQTRLEELKQAIGEKTQEFEQLDRVWQREKAQASEIKRYQSQLDQWRKEAENNRQKGNLARVSELQYGLIPEAERKLQALMENQQTAHMLRTEVTEKEVAQILSRRTGIPVENMFGQERERLIGMRDKLKEHVKGQDHAIDAVSNAIIRSRTGLSDPNRPVGSFIFVGPTGVGKTLLCRKLAQFLFDDERAVVRIDMSELMEKHAVARLIGAPPGYIGYDQGGYLTEQVRRKPYSVILLDEIEKAHPDVLAVFLQVLDEGRLTDGQGRTVNFKNSLVIMTSNCGAKAIQKAVASGSDDQAIKVIAHEALRAWLTPEFLNRVDDVVVFHGLKQQDLEAIVQVEINHLRQRLLGRGVQLSVDAEVLKWLAGNGFDPEYGARPLRQLIRSSIENAVADVLLRAEHEELSSISVALQGNQICVQLQT